MDSSLLQQTAEEPSCEQICDDSSSPPMLEVELVYQTENGFDAGKTDSSIKALQDNHILKSLHLVGLHDHSIDRQAMLNNELFELLLQFLKNSKSLRKVILNIGDSEYAGLFLNALSENPSVESVELRNVVISASALRNLIYGNNALMDLKVIGIIIEQPLDPMDVEDSRIESFCKIIQKLELKSGNDSTILFILSLFCETQLKLKECSITGVGNYSPMSLDLSGGIQHFLGRANSLETIEFAHTYFVGSTFRDIHTGILQNQGLETLKVQSCMFADDESSSSFTNMLKSGKSSVRSFLIIDHARFYHRTLSSVLSAIVSTNSTSSRLLEINLSGLHRKETINLRLSAILEPLQDQSTLQCLSLGKLTCPSRVQDLFTNIPKLRGIRELSFDIRLNNYEENKQLMIHAIRRNMSLEKIDFVSNVLEEDRNDQRMVDLSCDRNKSIARWIKNPVGCPRKLLHRVFKAALDYEYRYEIIFQAVLSLTS